MPKACGEALAERREFVGYATQTDLINALDSLLNDKPAFAKFSQQWLSRLERDRTGEIIAAAHGPRLRGLAYALRWSLGDMQTATGVDLGIPPGWQEAGIHPENSDWTPAGSLRVDAQKFNALANIYRVPVIGLAAAGTPVTDEEDARIIGWEYPTDTEYRPHMLCLEVDGESMNDGAADGMRHGDRLYVDPRDMQLQEGKVYVVHIHGNGIVVKRARKLGTDWWLFSDNSDYKPTRPDEATVIGRVYYHQPRGKRL